MQTPLFEQIVERVDRLLLRHEELARTNALLKAEVAQLRQERDSLVSRLSAARNRVDSLLDRLGDSASVTGPQSTSLAADQTGGQA
jgi:cell division protein ZapB